MAYNLGVAKTGRLQSYAAGYTGTYTGYPYELVAHIADPDPNSVLQSANFATNDTPVRLRVTSDFDPAKLSVNWQEISDNQLWGQNFDTLDAVTINAATNTTDTATIEWKLPDDTVGSFIVTIDVTAAVLEVNVGDLILTPGGSISGSYSNYSIVPTTLTASDGTNTITVSTPTINDNGDGTGTFSGTMPTMPTNGNTSNLILFGTVVVDLSGEATTSVSYQPAAGRDKVDLTSWAGTAPFATTPVATDQIEGPDTLTLNPDGTVDGPNGTYSLSHVQASTGATEAVSFSINVSDTTAPTVTSAVVPSAGDVVSVQMSETMQVGAGGTGGWTISLGDATVTTAAVDGVDNTIINLTPSRTLVGDDVLTIGYTQPTDGFQDLASPPNDLVTLSGQVVTNNSTQGPADTTPPVLSSATAAVTGATTLDGTVDTNEANGTLYTLVSANATEGKAAVKSGGQSQAVSATGTQSVSVVGLTENTSYYLHYMHEDSDANQSEVVSSPQVKTDFAAVPQGVLTVGTFTVGQVSASASVSYSLEDSTSLQYSFDDVTWTTFTPPLILSPLERETAYTGTVRVINPIGVGPTEAFSFTTLGGRGVDVSVPVESGAAHSAQRFYDYRNSGLAGTRPTRRKRK